MRYINQGHSGQIFLGITTTFSTNSLYIHFGELVLKILSRNEILTSVKGHKLI